MKNEKIVYATIAILLIACALCIRPAYMGNTSDGTATVGNNTPTVTNPGFFNSTDTGNVNDTTLTVDTEYHINCTITDNDELYDIEYINYTIWEDTYANIGDADSKVNHYSFTYFNDTDNFNETGPDAAGEAHIVSGSCTDPADHTSTSGTFLLAIKLHKTANYTASNTWKINITAIDGAGASGNKQNLQFGVAFYEEVTVSDTTHSWSAVSAGSNDNQIDSPADGDIDITVTANAKFDVQAKGSGDLSNGSDTISLGNVTIHETTVGSSISLNTSYTDIGGLTGEASGESQSKSFIVWIDVPAAQASGDYTYTLYVNVAQN